MNLIFREEDIELLDNMLQYLIKSNGVKSKINFLAEKIMSKDQLKDYENYFKILDTYCAEMSTQGAFGSDMYTIKADKRTSNFKYNGGFKGLFEREKRKFEEENELKIYQKKNIELQNEKMEYEKTIRKQEDIIRLWKLLTAIGGIFTLILSFFLFFFKS